MVIEINKDIDRYQESVAMGLTAKQLVFSIASVVVGGGMVLLLYPYIGLTGAAYVAIPCVAPIALGGFYSYNGMSFYEYMGRKIHFMMKNRPLTYVSTEGEAAIEAYRQEEEQSNKKGKKVKTTDTGQTAVEKQAAFERSKKKMRRTLIMLLVLIVLAVAAVAAWKVYGEEGGFINEHICRWLQAS